MGVSAFLKEIGIELEPSPAETLSGFGFDGLLKRPAFEELPTHMQEFIDGLDGLESVEQLNLIRQFTQSAVKYIPSEDESADKVQNFAETLANPKGDCDDIAVFEAGLVKYAMERGVSSFNDVWIVGGNIGYDFQDGAGNNQSADLEHNFVLVSENDQVFFLDPNAPQVGTGDAKTGGFNSTLTTSTGGTVDAHVFVNTVDFAQDVMSGVVSEPAGNIQHDHVSGPTAHISAPQVTASSPSPAP